MRKILVLLLILACSSVFGATRQKTWITGDTITANSLNADWDNFYSEKITAANINDGAVGNNQLGAISTAGKINLTALVTAGQSRGDIIYFNGTSWVRLGAGTAGQTLITEGTGANPSWKSVLNAWDAGAPWIVTTSYLAASNGFVVVYTTANTQIKGYTDAANPPTTLRCQDQGDTAGTGGANFTMPVIKGQYWEVTESAATSTIFWMPLGN
jgi:hypothetical protein